MDDRPPPDPKRKKKGASEDVLDVFEAAWLIGAHIETLRRMARSGKIPAYKVGKDWRFSKRALEDWRSAQQQPQSSRQEQHYALVADDEAGIRESVGIALRNAGYRVALAADGETAIQQAEQECPDIAVLDLSMPGVTGVDVLRRLRELDPGIPVVIMTGYPDGDLMHQALAYSPLLLHAKPVPLKDLLETVAQALAGRNR